MCTVTYWSAVARHRTSGDVLSDYSDKSSLVLLYLPETLYWATKYLRGRRLTGNVSYIEYIAN